MRIWFWIVVWTQQYYVHTGDDLNWLFLNARIWVNDILVLICESTYWNCMQAPDMRKTQCCTIQKHESEIDCHQLTDDASYQHLGDIRSTDKAKPLERENYGVIWEQYTLLSCNGKPRYQHTRDVIQQILVTSKTFLQTKSDTILNPQ